MKNRMTERQRKPYVKPRLRTIELVAEEVLTTGCKVLGGTGRNKASCGLTGNPCSAGGS